MGDEDTSQRSAEDTFDLLDLAGAMPSFVLGAVPNRVLDLTRGLAGATAARLPRARRSSDVVIPEPCQQFVAGLDSYGD